MDEAVVTLEGETFDALIGLAADRGQTPEDMLDAACRDLLSETAQKGFQQSFIDHRAFYEELAA